MLYETKTWTITGEYEFEAPMMTLLNPSMKVNGVTFSPGTGVIVSITINENGGLFKHYYSFIYSNPTNITDINEVVDAAMLEKYPTAVEQ